MRPTSSRARRPTPSASSSRSSGAPIEIVYDQGIPTETTNYTVIINNINNTNPDAVIHFGYAPNDIAFLRNVQDVGIKFKMLFSIYAGLETELLEKNVGAKGLEHVWTYVPPSELDYPVNFGMDMKAYKAAWDKKYPDGKIEFGFNAVAGYTTGLVIEKTLSVATSLDQMELRKRGVLAVRPAQDARRHLCARRDGRPDRRTDAARPARRSTSTSTSSSSRSIRTRPPPASRSIRLHEAGAADA